MHYAKRDLEKNKMADSPNTADTSKMANSPTDSTACSKDDPVLEYTRRATEQSNIAVNRLYQFYENERMRKAMNAGQNL